MVHQLPVLSGVNSAFTLTGTVPAAPFNAFSSVAHPANASQLRMFLSGGALSGSSTQMYTFCMDLFHGNPTLFPVVPSLAPSPPGLAANVGRIGYLYNEIGADLLSPTNGTAMQLALYELVYDVTPDLTSGKFVVNQSTTNPGEYTAAVNYLTASLGKDQRNFFLNVTPATPIGDLGRQGMIVTEKFNFANRVAQGDLSITITPDDTNEVGQPHTFTVTVQEDLGDGIDSDGNGSPFDPRRASVSVILTSLNGAGRSGRAVAGVTERQRSFPSNIYVGDGRSGDRQCVHDAHGQWNAAHSRHRSSHNRRPRARRQRPGHEDVRRRQDHDHAGRHERSGPAHTFTVTVYADNGDGIDNDGVMGTFDAVRRRRRRQRRAQ